MAYAAEGLGIKPKLLLMANSTVTRRLDGPRAAGFDRRGLLSIVTGQMADNKSTTVLTPFILYDTLINYYTQLIHNMVHCHNS